MHKRILLIFPNNPFRETCCDFLCQMGYKVSICDNPKFALTLGNKISPHLILCYENFDQVTGVEVARSMKRANALGKVPFLLMSARPEQEKDTFQKEVMMSVDDLIRLPIEQAELYGYITNWTENEKPSPVNNYPGAFRTDPPESPAKTTNQKQWNKGTVNLFSMGRLFFNLLNNRKAGILLLKGERRKMKIYIHDGNILDVVSNYMRDDTLGRFLIGIKKITRELNKETLEFAKMNDLPQGEAIVKMNILTSVQVCQYITEHKILKLLNVFQRRWYKSKFIFNESRVRDIKTNFKPTPLEKIIETGILNIARKKDIYDTFFQQNKEKLKLNISEDFDALAADLDLGPALVDQAMRINGHSIEQIKSNRADQFENNLRLAFLLFVTKGMTFAT